METLHPPTARFSMPLYNENSFSLHCKAKCYTALFSMLYNENYNQYSFQIEACSWGCVMYPKTMFTFTTDILHFTKV